MVESDDLDNPAPVVVSSYRSTTGHGRWRKYLDGAIGKRSRSARPHTSFDDRRCSGPSLRSAVELRLCEICGRLLENLIRAALLEVVLLALFRRARSSVVKPGRVQASRSARTSAEAVRPSSPLFRRPIGIVAQWDAPPHDRRPCGRCVYAIWEDWLGHAMGHILSRN